MRGKNYALNAKKSIMRAANNWSKHVNINLKMSSHSIDGRSTFRFATNELIFNLQSTFQNAQSAQINEIDEQCHFNKNPPNREIITLFIVVY